MTDIFHAGEIRIQTLTGERDIAQLNGRMIEDRIPERAASFLAQQSYCVLGWRAEDGDLWAMFWAGQTGFAGSSQDGSELRLAITRPSPDDALLVLSDLQPGDDVGVLFIDLSTRRRLRVNGQLADFSAGELVLAVREAFPNCPKYIQRRRADPGASAADPKVTQRGAALTPQLIGWIEAADTFFVASGLSTGAMDVSHRGGKAGFVKVADGRLRIPDYQGNSIFGTLGNFAVNPRAGLSFVDFSRRRQMQMTGDVSLEFDAHDDIAATGGTGRWWTFSPRHWIVSAIAAPLNWTAPENSPFNP